MSSALPQPLRLLRAGWRIVAACVLVAMLLGTGYLKTRHHTWSALSTLQIVNSNATTVDTADRDLFNLQQIAESDLIVGDAARSLGIPMSLMRTLVAVVPSTGSDTLVVSGTADTAANAQRVTRAYAASIVKLAGAARAQYYAAAAAALQPKIDDLAGALNNPATPIGTRSGDSNQLTALVGQQSLLYTSGAQASLTVTLLQAAPTPSSANGTSLSTGLTLAGVLGAVVGVAIVLIRGGARRTIDPSELVRGTTVEGLTVLGTVGPDASGDPRSELTGVLLDVLLAARAKGATGVLTVAGLEDSKAARALAGRLTDLSAQGRETVLVDADPLSRRPGETARGIDLPSLLPERAHEQAGLRADDPNVAAALLPALPRALERAREGVDVVVVLGPPVSSASGRAVAAAGDALLVVVPRNRTQRGPLRALTDGPLPRTIAVLGLLVVDDRLASTLRSRLRLPGRHRAKPPVAAAAADVLPRSAPVAPAARPAPARVTEPTPPRAGAGGSVIAASTPAPPPSATILSSVPWPGADGGGTDRPWNRSDPWSR